MAQNMPIKVFLSSSNPILSNEKSKNQTYSVYYHIRERIVVNDHIKKAKTRSCFGILLYNKSITKNKVVNN